MAAAPTTVAAIATEAAVSGREEAIVNVLLPPCSFTSAERGLESDKQRPWLLGLESLTTSHEEHSNQQKVLMSDHKFIM